MYADIYADGCADMCVDVCVDVCVGMCGGPLRALVSDDRPSSTIAELQQRCESCDNISLTRNLENR